MKIIELAKVNVIIYELQPVDLYPLDYTDHLITLFARLHPSSQFYYTFLVNVENFRFLSLVSDFHLLI